MIARRVFLKYCLGLGAGLFLPWYGWPEIVNKISSLARPAATVIDASGIGTAKAAASFLNREAMDDIISLAQPDLEGRRAGSAGEMKAAAYLMGQMVGLGLEPLGDPMANNKRNYFQAFTVYPVIEEFVQGRLTFRKGNPNDLYTPCANVIGGLMGTNRNESVILSAHYDHLGVFQGRLYPGANDNASGVGCILDVMRRLLKEGVKPKRNVVLAFWSAEEMGFVGSYSFLRKPTIASSIQAVLNVDTVGNGPLTEFSLWANSDNSAVQAIQAAAADSKASARLTPNNGYNSDQVYFNQDQIPAVTLMARDWLYKNHTPEDIPDFVNAEKVALAGDILYKATRKLIL
jgi:aminopeptidase YwaD